MLEKTISPAAQSTAALHTLPQPQSTATRVSDDQFLNQINIPARLDQLASQGISGPDLQLIAEAMSQWLHRGDGIAALQQQTLDLKSHTVQKNDIPTGSILVRKEDFPQTTAQARTLMLQNVPGINGIVGNTGDSNASHVLLWTAGDSNKVRSHPAEAGTVPEQVEARGGDHMQVQALAVQPGQYWVYSPQDRNVGDWAAQAGQMWEKVPYSRSALSTAIKPTPEFTRMSPSAKSDLVEVARDPFTATPAHARPPEKDHFKSMTEKPRVPGECCSSFIVRLYQVAQAQVDLANASASKPGTGSAQERMTEQEIDEHLNHSVDRFTGLLANHSEGMSPRSVEHFCRTGRNAQGDSQFEFKGVLTVKPQDVLYTEKEHHAQT